MKLIVTRIGVEKEKENRNKALIRMRTKVMTVFAGIALTLAVCLIAEKLPEKTVPASADMTGQGFLLPVICYENADEILLADDLEYLKSQGAVTVTCSEVISMVRGMEKIPETPVLLLFSGSDRSIYTKIYPVLQQNKEKGNAVICGSDADLFSGSLPKNSGAKLSWNEIRSMERSGSIETVSAGYALCEERKKISAKQLREDLLTMQTRMNEELFHDASVFVYPFSESDEQEKILKDLGFLMTLEKGDSFDRIGEANDLFEVEYVCRGEDPAAEFFDIGQ